MAKIFCAVWYSRDEHAFMLVFGNLVWSAVIYELFYNVERFYSHSLFIVVSFT